MGMSDSKQFERLLNEACKQYKRVVGKDYPVWRRGHHEMAFDLMFDYKISVKLQDSGRWWAANRDAIAAGDCPVEAVLGCFIDYAKHMPDFKRKEVV
jgi:hypothetical protein